MTEPSATFSACFGAPFLPLNPNVYATMLGERIARHAARVWLVNTGWTGGAYGVGRRITIGHTRATIAAALAGQLDAVGYQRHAVFNIDTPTSCPGVPAGVLDPRSTWTDATRTTRRRARWHACSPRISRRSKAACPARSGRRGPTV